ncbi:Domain of uncharacterised function (DUF3596) [Shewanella putrefaciens]|nr:Domain of uncharacterised function (DUF3596) [Shewanella putrefaciens]SUI89601.1 Domain of uncharacterised function (DUF3596) [Shewanella putrefaciens]
MLMSKRLGKGTKMLATPKNLATAKTTLKKMNAEIDLGCFQYRDYFPKSKKIVQFELLQREKHPDREYPFFNDFAYQWFERKKATWKNSYRNTIQNVLDKYLIPQFGNTLKNAGSPYRRSIFIVSS